MLILANEKNVFTTLPVHPSDFIEFCQRVCNHQNNIFIFQN